MLLEMYMGYWEFVIILAFIFAILLLRNYISPPVPLSRQ
jgi:hypothetical protein